MQFTSSATINFHGLNSTVHNLAGGRSGWSFQVSFKNREGVRYKNYCFLLVVMSNSQYLYWMQPITGVDIVLSNLQNTSRTISLHAVKYEAICDIIHQTSTILSPLPNITLHWMACCYLCHLFPLPSKPSYKKLAIARALPFERELQNRNKQAEYFYALKFITLSTT